MKRTFLLVTILYIRAALISCSKGPQVPAGAYKVGGITSSEWVLNNKIDLYATQPTFHFEEGYRLRIESDFPFDLFKDSLYSYRINGEFLNLQGASEQKRYKIQEREAGQSYSLFLGEMHIQEIIIRRK
ncbi:MAG: hypothetical protein IJ952_00865 [Alistipes sp.]|nr:hypothetical protein [Alistipes sp.]